MFLVLVLFTFDVSYGWMNALDKPLSYICPNGKAIFEINSKHDNFYEDRVFDIQCRSTGRAVGGCQWTDYVNNFDQPFNFQCPGQSALFGLQSEHENTYEDRRWKFYCCDLPGVQLADCYSTPHSEYDRAFSVLAPNNNVIRGVSSVVDNYYQDRQYTFNICQMK